MDEGARQNRARTAPSVYHHLGRILTDHSEGARYLDGDSSNQTAGNAAINSNDINCRPRLDQCIDFNLLLITIQTPTVASKHFKTRQGLKFQKFIEYANSNDIRYQKQINVAF